MITNYWTSIVEDLKKPQASVEASHVLAAGLGEGKQIDETSLGEALHYVPQEELIAATLLAYQNKGAQPYCDLILWYFEPEEIVNIFKNMNIDDENVKKGLTGFLKKENSPLAEEIS